MEMRAIEPVDAGLVVSVIKHFVEVARLAVNCNQYPVESILPRLKGLRDIDRYRLLRRSGQRCRSSAFRVQGFRSWRRWWFSLMYPPYSFVVVAI